MNNATTRRPRSSRPSITPYDIATRRDLAAALDRASSGHPKPALVAKLSAELDALDARYPTLRAACHAITVTL